MELGIFDYPRRENPLGVHFVGDDCFKYVDLKSTILPFVGKLNNLYVNYNHTGLRQALERYGISSIPELIWKMKLAKWKLLHTQMPLFDEVLSQFSESAYQEYLDLNQQYPLDSKLLLVEQKEVVKMSVTHISGIHYRYSLPIPIEHVKDEYSARAGLVVSAPKGRERLLISYPYQPYSGTIADKPKIDLSPVTLGEWHHEVSLEDSGIIMDEVNTFIRYNNARVLNS